MKEEIDSIIMPILTQRKNVGIIIGVLTPDQNATFGYGRTSEIRTMLPDASTVFEIGSITKVFTATLLASTEIMQMFHVKHRDISLPDSTTRGIALGWHITTSEDKKSEYYWHSGATGGYQCYTRFIKDNKRAVVVLCNYATNAKDPFVDHIGQTLLHALSKRDRKTTRYTLVW